MKIIQVCPYYPPAEGYGGVIRVVTELADRLTERGHDVTVYTTDAGGSRDRIKADNPVERGDVTVYYFKNISDRLASRASVPIPLGAISSIRRSISNFDLVHVHGYPHLLTVAAAHATRHNDVPLVLTPHGAVNLPDEAGQSLQHKIFDKLFGRYIFQRVDSPVALTPDEADRLRNHTNLTDPIIIRNGIDYRKHMISDQRRSNIRDTYDMWGSLCVGFIGRLHKKKGLDVLLRLAQHFNDVCVNDKSIKFIIVGPSDGASELEASLDELDNTSVLGYLSEDKKNAMLSALDIFVLPSHSEGQPLAVLEAMAAGTPVIISEACGLPIVEQYGAGAVPSMTVDAFVRRLQEFLTDAEKRTTAGKQARRAVEMEFGWESVIDRHIELYQKIS